MAVTAGTFDVTIDGEMLERGFWLYVWEVTAPDDRVLMYVGRTGDSSSPNAQSPFNRMGQHLGSQKNSSMLRNHLADKNHIDPNACRFRLVAHGPILDEADGMEEHIKRRDIVGAMEKQLASDLRTAGYHVLNNVNCLKPLDRDRYAAVRAAFGEQFPLLAESAESV